MYGFYFLVALCHFIVMIVANQEYLRQDEERQLDSIFVVHMTLAILLNLVEVVFSSFYNKKIDDTKTTRHSFTVSVEFLKHTHQGQKEIKGSHNGDDYIETNRDGGSATFMSTRRQSRPLSLNAGRQVGSELEFMLAKEDYRHVRNGYVLSSKWNKPRAGDNRKSSLGFNPDTMSQSSSASKMATYSPSQSDEEISTESSPNNTSLRATITSNSTTNVKPLETPPLQVKDVLISKQSSQERRTQTASKKHNEKSVD